LQPPTSHRLPDGFRRGSANCRSKIYKDTTVAIFGTSGTKRVPQKIKLDDIVFLLSVDILAIDDLGLIRMQFQTAFFQSALKSSVQVFCLFETATMDQCIICISAERQLRKLRCHPPVKRIMQEQVRQQWGDDAPYAKGNFEFEHIINYVRQKKI
jgi:hypothetical protein